jgi:hypothetical protein
MEIVQSSDDGVLHLLWEETNQGEDGMRRFEMLSSMHMGPLQRQINNGDVIGWDSSTRTMMINGSKIGEAKGMDFEKAIAILERQILKFPDNPWMKELAPVNMAQIEIKTGTQVVLPILGCLKAAEEFLGEHEGWNQIKREVKWAPQNEDQYQFLKRFLDAKAVVDALGDNLKRKADRDINVINAWLKEHGFDIQLYPEADPRTFAVASILDVLVEWVKEGDITTIYNSKGTFPAVKIKSDGDNIVRFTSREIHPFPIAGIRTKSRDLVRMSVLDFMPDDTFAISDKVEQLRKATVRANIGGCDGVIFPMVDYNRPVDIEWICGMETGDKPDDYYIGQALQQTIFRMNEKGAHAKSAVAMTMRCKCMESHDNWIRIDKPFILWIERPGVATPLFAGVFAEDVWKKPESL